MHNNTTTKTQLQQHNHTITKTPHTTTKTQKHNHTNTKTQPHHHKILAAELQPDNHKNTTAQPQEHNHTTKTIWKNYGSLSLEFSMQNMSFSTTFLQQHFLKARLCNTPFFSIIFME